MKFYINNKELSEKVFWRTLESLVSPMQRVHILDWNSVMLLKVNMNNEIVDQKIYYLFLWKKVVQWKK